MIHTRSGSAFPLFVDFFIDFFLLTHALVHAYVYVLYVLTHAWFYASGIGLEEASSIPHRWSVQAFQGNNTTLTAHSVEPYKYVCQKYVPGYVHRNTGRRQKHYIPTEIGSRIGVNIVRRPYVHKRCRNRFGKNLPSRVSTIQSVELTVYSSVFPLGEKNPI